MNTSPVVSEKEAALRRASRKSTVSRRFSLSSWQVLLLMTAASFVIRVAAWAYFGTGTIESEGAEYARIAQNLRHGVGYVGLVSPGPQVLFNPLFSFLIAGVSFVVHDYERAGRLVALIMGGLLPLPVFGIASRLFSRRVGLIAGVLTVLHPLSVYLSFMVYSEGPYATLLLSAIYLVVRALEEHSTRLWLFVGGLFGLCYLLRAEAVAALAISLLFMIVSTAGSLAVKSRRAAFTTAAFLAFALPQIIFIYRSTGKVLLEGKTTILFNYTGRRILAAERKPGIDYVSDAGRHEVPSRAPDNGGYPATWEEKWATYAIDSDRNGTGFAMRPWVDMARETHIELRDFIPLVVRGMRRNIPGLFEKLSSRWLGAPLLPALALLGAFRRPWRGPQALTRAYVLFVTAAPVAATLLVLWGDDRYYFIFVPLLCIWAASGLFELGLWARTSSAALRWKSAAHPTVYQWLFPSVIGLAMIIFSVGPVKSQYEFTDSGPLTRVDKEVGLWIQQRDDRTARIMDLATPLSYHANAQHVYFPYCSGDLALRYLDTAQVDYVVLRRGAKFTRYYEDWLVHGIPDSRAELLQLPSQSSSDKFVIYKWHRTQENASTIGPRYKWRFQSPTNVFTERHDGFGRWSDAARIASLER